MKKLTLDFNERQEEEEFQDLYGGVSEMRNRKILNIFIEIYFQELLNCDFKSQ